MRRRTVSVSLLGISFAVLLASCGGGRAGSSTVSTTAAATAAGGRQRQAAESTLASYFEARAKEDWKAACSFLSSSIRTQLEQLAQGSGGKAKGCASVLAMSSKGETAVGLASQPTDALTSLRVRGNDAFALWVGPHGQRYAMPMVREGGGWRPAQVAPLPYPSGGEP
jgi:hypothetical protein